MRELLMRTGPAGEFGHETATPLAVALPLTCRTRMPVTVDASWRRKADAAVALLKATM